MCTRWSDLFRSRRSRTTSSARSIPPGGKSYSAVALITNSSLPRARRTAMSPLSDHLIKAARYATKYLIGRLLGGYLRKWIFSPTAPYASARTITPHDAPGLRFRDTSIDACPVAVGAFYQTRREPLSLHFRKCRFLSTRERHRCRRRNPKHRQSHLYFLKVQHYGSSLQSAKWNKRDRTSNRIASIHISDLPARSTRRRGAWIDWRDLGMVSAHERPIPHHDREY